MTSVLRPLTLSAVTILVMLAPLADATPIPTAERTRSGTPVPIHGLPTGPPPRIAYAFATEPAFLGGNFRLHRPDGRVSRLGFLANGQWSTLGPGVIGIAATEAGPQLQRINAHGKVVRRQSLTHSGLAVSPDHTIVSWLDDQRRPRDLERRGARVLTLPRVPKGDSVGAVLGSHTCQEQVPEGGGCAIFVNVPRNHGVFVSTSHGIVAPVRPVLNVTDVNERGRVIGLSSRATRSATACWGEFTPSGRRVWRTCRYRLDAFGPGGRRILAEHLQSTTGSVTRFAVLDQDGDVRLAYTFRPRVTRTLTDLTWEDAHHLLGILRTAHAWSIVRIGTDGTVEYAVAPVRAVNEFSAFSLPIR